MSNIKTMDEFITQVFKRYPPTGKEENQLMKLNEYRELLKAEAEYNYNNAYNKLVSSFTMTRTPTIDELRDVLSKNIIKEYSNASEPYITETLITRKGNLTSEYGVKLENYAKDIEFFKLKGLTIVKLKYCDKECMKCNYNHVCETAKQLRA